MQHIVPTQHCKNEWSRMAQNAYATNRNAFGHCFSAAASLPHDGQMTLHYYDSLQAAYRAWLVFGEWKPVA